MLRRGSIIVVIKIQAFRKSQGLYIENRMDAWELTPLLRANRRNYSTSLCIRRSNVTGILMPVSCTFVSNSRGLHLLQGGHQIAFKILFKRIDAEQRSCLYVPLLCNDFAQVNELLDHLFTSLLNSKVLMVFKDSARLVNGVALATSASATYWF